jgi:hypothetical protein
MFVRYVIPCRDEDSHCLTGVFQAAFSLRDRGLLDRDEARRFEGLRQWFNLRLPVPDRFCRSRGRQAHRQAICWFKQDAAEYLGKVRALATLLEQHGIPTRVLRTRRPGYIVYEDNYQVAAVPFRDTPS